MSTLTFEKPDEEKFPCLGLAYRAAEEGGTAPAVLNAANEVAVHSFLDNRIPFKRIPSVVEETLIGHERIDHPSLEEILAADQWARHDTTERIQTEG